MIPRADFKKKFFFPFVDSKILIVAKSIFHKQEKKANKGNGKLVNSSFKL